MVKQNLPPCAEMTLTEFFNLNPKLLLMVKTLKGSPIYKVASDSVVKHTPTSIQTAPVTLSRNELDALCMAAIVALDLCDAIVIC